MYVVYMCYTINRCSSSNAQVPPVVPVCMGVCEREGEGGKERERGREGEREMERANYRLYCRSWSMQPVEYYDSVCKMNNDLYQLFPLPQRGEKMSHDEVQAIIDEADKNGDGKLDYAEFCHMLLNTSEQCVQASRQKAKRLGQQQPPPGQANSRWRGEQVMEFNYSKVDFSIQVLS